MPGNDDATRENWEALRRLASVLFRRLREQNADWDYEDLSASLKLANTRGIPQRPSRRRASCHAWCTDNRLRLAR